MVILTALFGLRSGSSPFAIWMARETELSSWVNCGTRLNKWLWVSHAVKTQLKAWLGSFWVSRDTRLNKWLCVSNALNSIERVVANHAFFKCGYPLGSSCTIRLQWNSWGLLYNVESWLFRLGLSPFGTCDSTLILESVIRKLMVGVFGEWMNLVR